MSEKWSEFARRMEDKEAWLAALLEKEPGGESEALGLYATASLVRGAVNAADVPESAQSQSRARALALLAEQLPEEPQSSLPSSWSSRLGSWLQLAFNLFRRR
jgi:hypothetical protein